MHHFLHPFFWFFFPLLLLLSSNESRAWECKLNNANPLKVAFTITVSPSPGGNFTKIQDAINFIPEKNYQWIHVQISPGTYQEKVTIPLNKPCIFLEGAGSTKTQIQWDDHETMASSPTFTSNAEYFVAKGISFQNTYNIKHGQINEKDMKQAVAASINGDKSAFLSCEFASLQDTLNDNEGRHYFQDCHIRGVTDFIFGNGQSTYEKCTANVTVKEYVPHVAEGYITAQGRDSEKDRSGYVFRNCKFVGSGGKALLGRAYRGFSRVIVFNSELTDIIEPQGWSAWNKPVQNIEYSETGCTGAGANTSKRVPWMKKLSSESLKYFTEDSFMDDDGWMAKLPPSVW